MNVLKKVNLSSLTKQVSGEDRKIKTQIVATAGNALEELSDLAI